MQEQLISFETAKLAKEKGFNIPTREFYPDQSWTDKEEIFNCTNIGYPEYTSEIDDDGFGAITLIPTQSLLQKWLREEHKLYLSVDCCTYNTPERYSANLSGWASEDMFLGILIDGFTIFKTYEEALEEGLVNSLNLI